MKIKKYSVGTLQTNCYFLTEGESVIIIDAGGDAEFLSEEIQRQNLKVIGIFATHGHFDHILGVGELQLNYGVPLSIFKEDEFLVKRVKDTAKHFLKLDPHMVEPSSFSWLKEGKMELGPLSFDVFHTPGHTPGACCLYFKEHNVIFTGDTLFKGAIGRYDFSYSDKAELKRSLQRLFNLPEQTYVYPGHEEETFIGEEKKQDLSFL